MKKTLAFIIALAMVFCLSLAVADGDKVTATGKGQGIDGDVVVKIEADQNKIYSVEVVEQNETPGIGSVAVEKLPDAIVEANSLLVDSISGATVTSVAITTAVREALTSAGLDPAAFENEIAAPEAPAEKENVTRDCDIVIVGAGGAGLTAAVRANQEGAKVPMSFSFCRKYVNEIGPQSAVNSDVAGTWCIITCRKKGTPKA